MDTQWMKKGDHPATWGEERLPRIDRIASERSKNTLPKREIISYMWAIMQRPFTSEPLNELKDKHNTVLVPKASVVPRRKGKNGYFITERAFQNSWMPHPDTEENSVFISTKRGAETAHSAHMKRTLTVAGLAFTALIGFGVGKISGDIPLPFLSSPGHETKVTTNLSTQTQQEGVANVLSLNESQCVGKNYTVEPGDTMRKIILKFNTSWPEPKQSTYTDTILGNTWDTFNPNIPTNTVITAGEQLQIPDCDGSANNPTV